MENKAAYIDGPKKPLVVRSAPFPKAGPNQIVVRNHAIALNPLEQLKQTMGNFIYEWIKYPFVMGSDIAGDVVDVGPGVTRFKAGDRVVGHCLGLEKKHNDSAMGGFQLYSILNPQMVSHVPSSMDYQTAAVIPLGLSTASCGLFQKDQLALRYPKAERTQQPAGEKKEVLLIWGGSSSVGCNAIQLATAAGYEVITTASPRNFDLVKSLGATKVFDYRSTTVVSDIIRELTNRTVAGAMSIGAGAAESCAEILSKSKGNRFLACVSYPAPANPDAGTPARIFTFISFMARMSIKCSLNGIRMKFVFGSTLEDNEVSKIVYEDYLGQALANGTFTPAPAPEIIGTELEAVQGGLDMLKKGVSAKKLVVKLRD